MAHSFDSVVMYESWLDVARSKLPEDEANKLMVQLMEYGFKGIIPRNDNVIMDVIFEMAKPNIDSNIRNKINGKKGGRKPKNTRAKTSGLSNANGNANVNGNANGNVNVLPPVDAPAIEDAGDLHPEEMPEWVKEGPNAVV